jgi:hypothetical protein
MKKVLMAVLMVLMFSAMVWAAATPMQYTKVLEVGKGGSIAKIVFNNTSDSVDNASSETFKLDLGGPNWRGAIKEIYFESSSTNCDIWLSEVDEALATASETLIIIRDINLGASPGLYMERYFINRDPTAGNYLYLTISNQGGGATGAWDLILTKEKY